MNETKNTWLICLSASSSASSIQMKILEENHVLVLLSQSSMHNANNYCQYMLTVKFTYLCTINNQNWTGELRVVNFKWFYSIAMGKKHNILEPFCVWHHVVSTLSTCSPSNKIGSSFYLQRANFLNQKLNEISLKLTHFEISSRDEHVGGLTK